MRRERHQLLGTIGATTGRITTPEEVALLIAFTASPNNINGAEYLIDGASSRTYERRREPEDRVVEGDQRVQFDRFGATRRTAARVLGVATLIVIPPGVDMAWSRRWRSATS
jgi:hypothetical protein